MDSERKKHFENILKENSRPNGECIEWTGKLTQKGYGYLSVPDNIINMSISTKTYSTIGAHRLSFLLTYGEIKNKLYICHKCNNPKCINPEHLYAGTAKENASDYRNSPGFLIRKLKQINKTKPKPDPELINLIEIHLAKYNLNVGEFSDRIGVSRAYFSRIKNGLIKPSEMLERRIRMFLNGEEIL